MNIGVIGSGNIGSTAARLFVQAGHDVAIANSRGPESLQGLVADLGEHVRASTVEEATRFGNLVLVAIPFGRYRGLPADAFTDKIVVDANNYYPERDGGSLSWTATTRPRPSCLRSTSRAPAWSRPSTRCTSGRGGSAQRSA